MDQLTAWMRDWKNVLPVLRHEWEEHPQLFDPDGCGQYEPVRQGASSRQS